MAEIRSRDKIYVVMRHFDTRVYDLLRPEFVRVAYASTVSLRGGVRSRRAPGLRANHRDIPTGTLARVHWVSVSMRRRKYSVDWSC